MGPKVITTAHLQTTSKEARDKLIGVFKTITDFSKANEPGVHRYITAVPIDSSDETSIYMIEEYADQAACDSHFKTDVVQGLVSLMGSSPPLLAGAPEIYNLAPSIEYVRPGEPKPDTLMILAHFEYKDGKSTNALAGWTEFVEYCKKNEPQTLAYCITEDKEKNTVRTVEVYENAQFVSDFHLKSPAVKANQDQNGVDRTGAKGAVKLKIVQGFLSR